MNVSGQKAVRKRPSSIDPTTSTGPLDLPSYNTSTSIWYAAPDGPITSSQPWLPSDVTSSWYDRLRHPSRCWVSTNRASFLSMRYATSLTSWRFSGGAQRRPLQARVKRPTGDICQMWDHVRQPAAPADLLVETCDGSLLHWCSAKRRGSSGYGVVVNRRHRSGMPLSV